MPKQNPIELINVSAKKVVSLNHKLSSFIYFYENIKPLN